MNSIQNELDKNGIQVVRPLDRSNANALANYVARTLTQSFPELKLSFKSIYMNIINIPMMIAKMPSNMNDACYFYKNNTIYFREGINIGNIKSVAFHECLHHLQEIKDNKGVLHRLGLCSYVGNRAYGNALNEASVQLMTAYATKERFDRVTYYGINFPTPSPNYYPMLCNLVRQIGFITGFTTLYQSTFYSDNLFFEKFKKLFGDKNSYTIQQNLDKLLDYEEKISKYNSIIQTEDLSYKRFNILTSRISNLKDKIQKTFLSTQTLIIKSFFDNKVYDLKSANQVIEYRKCLYSFNNLIGTTETYTFFNDYYIKQMNILDQMYENAINNKALAVVKKSKISIMFNAIRKLFVSSELKDININT